MLKRFIIYLSVILTITACNNFSGPKKPKNLISKEKMVNILIDARLLGSANNINKNIMQKHGIEVSSYVFEKYGIDSLQFALSNEYYAYHIKDYEEIYDKVIDSLEELKVVFKDLELKEKKDKEKEEKDSINSLKTKKDSLNELTTQDSLKKPIKRDSLIKSKFKKKFEEEEGVLISPVSETSSQSQK